MHQKPPPDLARADTACPDAELRRLSLHFPATDLDVRCSMVLLEGLLASAGVGRADAEKTELVLTEVLNNVVEHAMPTDQNREIHLELCLSSSVLTCKISDSGRAMPGGEPPMGAIDIKDVPRAELPEGGFGWMLIRRLTQSLTFRRLGCENHLELAIPLARPLQRYAVGVKNDASSKPLRRAPAS